MDRALFPNGRREKQADNLLQRPFSGGEVQRIHLARVFLMTNASIIVIDEGTSALDPYTKADIRDNLKKHGKGKTIIYITYVIFSPLLVLLLSISDDSSR
jgi:ABC-type transport system involved in cytochrome bd biosynthesis fused ATPase/permease subunit